MSLFKWYNFVNGNFVKENQKWFWSTSGHEVDYFIHTWSYSGDRVGVTHEYEWRDISKKEYKDICDYYEVKDGIYDTTPQEWFYDNDALG